MTFTYSKQCKRCGEYFDISAEGESPDDWQVKFALWKKFCNPCCVIGEKELEEEQSRKAKAESEERWNAVCPPIYRTTEITHQDLNPAFREAAMAWDALSDRGLGFMGNSGAGKTRLLFFALRKAFDADQGVRYITHNAFSKLVIEAFSGGHAESKNEAMRSLENLNRVRVLLIDDLGKAPSTERSDAELEELIETRGANLRPTLWSCNGYGEWLVKRFGADRGEPLVRRLAEFSTVVKA